MKMSSIGSMRSFLFLARSTLQQYHSAPERDVLTLVMGNESADLDSIVSSLLYAYLKTASLPVARHRDVSISGKSQARMHVPVLNIPRAEIRIRPELLKLLPYANIEPEHLITIDDLQDGSSGVSQSKDISPSPGENDAGRGCFLHPRHTRIVLVDHNAMDGPLSPAFDNSVVGCIDHHEDEGKVPTQGSNLSGDAGSGQNAYPRVITKCGSCTSLVIKHTSASWDRLSESALAVAGANTEDDASVGVQDSAVRHTWDAQIARLALGSVLIDTHNLTDNSKTTGDDVDVVNYLEAKVGMAPPEKPGEGDIFDRKSFFKEIKTAKADIQGLSVLDCMRKDYKEWAIGGNTGTGGKAMRLGMSTIVKPLRWLKDKANQESPGGPSVDGNTGKLMEAVTQYAAQRDLAVYAILTTKSSREDGSRREILMLVREASLGSLTKTFESEAGHELGLEGHGEHELRPMDAQHAVKAWLQLDVSKTRKQVAPLLRRIIEQ